MTNQTVEVGVGSAVNVQLPAADVVDGLIVHHEGTVGVLQGGVGGQDGVVGLHHSSGHLGGRVNRKLQLRLLAIIHREPLHQERSAGATIKGVEDEKSLEPSALVGKLSDPVQHQVNNLLADGVVAPGVVVGRVLLARDELLGVEELPVGPSPHNSHGHVLPHPVYLFFVLSS